MAGEGVRREVEYRRGGLCRCGLVVGCDVNSDLYWNRHLVHKSDPRDASLEGSCTRRVLAACLTSFALGKSWPWSRGHYLLT